MPHLEYLTPADLPGSPRTVYEREGRKWHLVAVIVHYDPESDREKKRLAILHPDTGGGTEWEIPWNSLEAMP